MTLSNETRQNDNDSKVEKKKVKRRNRIYRYPADIGSDEQPHAINFYIYQTETASEREARTQDLAARKDKDANAAAALKIENDKTKFLALTGGTLFGTLAGGGMKASGSGNFVSAGTAAATGAGATKLIQNSGATQTRQTRKIDSSISLYIPNSPQAKYGAEFNIENIGTLMGGGLAGELNVMGTLNDMSTAFNANKSLTDPGAGVAAALEAASGSGLGSVLARTVASAGNLPRELGLGDLNVSGAIRSATRTVRNPYKEQIFQTMGFRSFAFEYKFAPRNERELRDVMEIVSLFKSHMHPEKDLGGLFFTFPSQFEIEYVYKNRKNRYLNKIAPSFLTDLSVDYGNGGTFTTFKDARGAPSEITMSMAFREAELLTRSQVQEEGY
mgnify:FL=1|tara:strand:+ start:1521 stop:2678 length:1158 start_codon:yes stop_codon:yes gene_type:complete